MCGYGNALSFKNISDYDIEYVEKHIRENISRDSTLKLKANMKNIFGNEVDEVLNHFQFRRGDVVLIEELVKHVKMVFTELGPKHFTPDLPKYEAQSNDALQQMIQWNSINQYETKTHFFLIKLLSAAERNSKRKKEGYRFDHDIKLFAAYLRMIVGPLAYETIHRYLEASIPSLSSTNRYIRSYKIQITEGILRHEELKLYLQRRKLQLIVSFAEDATRIVDKVQYDANTNQLIGFVPPINKSNGMPIPLQFPARSAEEMLGHFASEHSVSAHMIVVMAQPIADIPPFCLLAFGTDNKQSANDVSNRWRFITSELKKVGIDVITIASDSDPKYNSAMRKLSKLGQKSKYDWFSIDIKFIL